MFGNRGRKQQVGRKVVLADPAGDLEALGYLIPPGRTTERTLAEGLRLAMQQRRFLAGHGVPSVPTRYVVGLNPGDRAALHPRTEDRLARMLTAYAEDAGDVLLGDLRVECETDPQVAPGRPRYWAGFADDDLLVLSSPGAAATVFARA